MDDNQSCDPRYRALEDIVHQIYKYGQANYMWALSGKRCTYFLEQITDAVAALDEEPDPRQYDEMNQPL